MKDLIACCGLDCETCDARIATVTNDAALRQKTERLWSEMNHVPITKEMGEAVLATADIGKADKGRHTTTGREMFCSRFGGVLIDTPGMRELGAESADFGKTFDDIEELAKHCKFRDCIHVSEPGCAILEASENGTLKSRRFQNYCKLKNEAGYDGLTAKEIEVKKLERMFKDVGRMKNVRKYAKEKRK